MKKIIIGMVLIGIIIFSVIGCECFSNSEQSSQIERNVKKSPNPWHSRTDGNAHGRKIADKIFYIKDKEAGICFAVFDQETARSDCYRFGLTYVPCEAVPKELLLTEEKKPSFAKAMDGKEEKK